MAHMSSGARPTDAGPAGQIANRAKGGGAGVGSSPVEGSVLQQGATRKTGECPQCGGRARLDGNARLLEHTSATTAGR